MNFAEEVGGDIGNQLCRLRLYEDEDSRDASHIVDTVWDRTTPTSIVARAHRFAEDGDTCIPVGWVRVTVTYEPDGEPS